MVGKWYIDGVDIYSKYKVGIAKGGYNDLFTFPALSTPDTVSWFENDGIDIDLSNPRLENKTVDITFISKSKDNVSIEDFLTFLTEEGYRTLEIPSLNRSWKLRFINEQSRTVYAEGQEFSILFVDDFPLELIPDRYFVLGTQEYDYITTQDGSYLVDIAESLDYALGHEEFKHKSLYQLDGKGFGEYGLIVEQGKAEIYKIPAIKEALTQKNKLINGAVYDTGLISFKEKDITLKCCFYSSAPNRLWNSYINFFRDLVEYRENRPQLRQLTVDYMVDVFDCYYKSTENFSLISSSQFTALRFNLNLVFTGYRPRKTTYLLGTEDTEYITTENLNEKNKPLIKI